MTFDDMQITGTITVASATEGLTVESIIVAMKRAKDHLATYEALPVAYVTTNEIREMLSQFLDANNPCGPEAALCRRFRKFDVDSAFGIPIESYPTLAEAIARNIQLTDEGKKTVLITK